MRDKSCLSKGTTQLFDDIDPKCWCYIQCVVDVDFPVIVC